MRFGKLPFERVNKVRRSTLLIGLLVSFMIGLWIARYELPLSPGLLLATLALFPLAISRKPRAITVIVIIGLSLGLLRGQAVWAQFHEYDRLVDQKISVVGKVVDDSAYDNKGQKEFHIEQIKYGSDKLPGKMRIAGYSSPIGIDRGDTVKVTGKLREGFGSYQSSIGFAQIEIVSRDNSVVKAVRGKFFSGVFTALPEPQASLGLGFLVGLRALLPEELLDQLSRTGLTHIVAVSGYNLTVLVRVARRGFMRISKFSATFAAFSLIIIFLAVTGLAPSIFRASIVSGFALLAWYYGRPIRPMMLLGLSGAITAGINPFFIWFDIGWWLSFTAFFGVLILAPTSTQRIFRKEGKDLPMIAQIAIETTSAQIMALPIIVAIFGELSLISIIANVLIVPFIPYAMAVTFVAGLGGALIPVIAGWLALPAKVILTTMTAVISLLASVPFALVEVDVGWSLVVVWYLALLSIYWITLHKLTTDQKLLITQTNHIE